MERISIEIDKETKKEIKVKAAAENKTIKEVVLVLLRKWLKTK